MDDLSFLNCIFNIEISVTMISLIKIKPFLFCISTVKVMDLYSSDSDIDDHLPHHQLPMPRAPRNVSLTLKA